MHRCARRPLLRSTAIETPPRSWDEGPQARFHLGQAPHRGRVGGVEVGLLVAEDVGEQGDGVAQVVEHHDHIGQEKGHVGEAQVVGRRGGKMLDVTNAFVAEVPHGAAHERRQPLERGHSIAAKVLCHEGKGVSAMRGEIVTRIDSAAADGHRTPRQTDAFPGLDAQEGVTPQAQSLFGALQQKAAVRLAQLQKGRDRSLGIVEEVVRDRYHVIAGAQPARLFT